MRLDVGFLASLIDTLKRVFPIDSTRIAITGFSAGGLDASLVIAEFLKNQPRQSGATQPSPRKTSMEAIDAAPEPR